MTKTVRVENADTSSYKVVVETWDKGRPDTVDAPGTPDTLASTVTLGHPTALQEFGITSTRYLVIKEA
mgnify:CR=1 FL=1